MGRRLGIVIACVALVSCNVILGMGDLDVKSKSSASSDHDDFDWDFDAGDPFYSDASVADAESDSSMDGSNATSKRVFVTAATFGAKFGDVASGNAKCQAAAAKLGGEWVAWLSGNASQAINALTFDGPYVLLDGTQVAAGKADLLAGTLAAPINIGEDGKKIESGNVWTGTKKNSATGDTCTNWTSTNVVQLGTMGSLDQKDNKWTDNGGPPGLSGWPCSADGRLYCFEK